MTNPHLKELQEMSAEFTLNIALLKQHNDIILQAMSLDKDDPQVEVLRQQAREIFNRILIK